MIVIKPNEHDINDMDFSKDYIKEYELSPDVMEQINGFLLTEKFTTIDTETCLETKDFIYQFCHLDIPDEHMDEQVKTNINRLAIYLSPEHKIVTGTICLLKVTNQENMTFGKVDISDVELMIGRKKIHNGLIIKANGTVKPFKFSNEAYKSEVPTLETFVKEYFNLDLEVAQLISDRFNACNYAIEIYGYLSNSISSIVSENVSALYGKKVFGDAILVSCATDNLYSNLEEEEYYKLLKCVGKPLIKKERAELNNRFLMLERVSCSNVNQ